MLHRGIKVAYAILMIVSAVMTFIVMRNVDENSVSGPSFAISFHRIENGASGSSVATMIDGFVHENGANVGRLYHDSRDDGMRRIYLAVGDSKADSTGWLTHGYPAFSRDSEIELRPYSEIINIYPDGLYYVYGSEQAATRLVKEFQQLGYYGDFEPLSLEATLGHYASGALLWCFVIIGLVTVLLVASAVTLNAKAYGIQRLQGQSYVRILVRDLAQVLRFASVAILGVSAATTALLYLYNGLHQAMTFALVALSLAGVYILIALIAHVLTLAIVHRDIILNAVKGEVTASWAIAGSYLLRFAAMALIFSVGTSVVVSAVALKESRDKRQTWAEIHNAYYLRLSGAIDHVQAGNEHAGEEIDNRLGQWLRGADDDGKIALAWHFGPSSQLSRAVGRDLLVVNNRYLEKHEIYDAAGARVKPEKEPIIRLLVPERLGGQAAVIANGIDQWAKFQSSRARLQKFPPTRIEKVRDDQHVLSYDRSFADGGLVLDEPVVVVLTGSSGVIPNSEYTAVASRGEILFEDPDRAIGSLTAAGLDPYILGMSPFAQEADDKYREDRREFVLQVTNLLATIAILLITALALSIVYCRRNLQILFVKYICGWGFLRSYRRILAVEAGLTLALMLGTWHFLTAIINTHNSPGAPPAPAGILALHGWEPALAGGAALLSLVLFVLILRQTSAAIAKAHSASLS
jgi:hypothetical protein